MAEREQKPEAKSSPKRLRRFLRWTWKLFVVYCMVSLALSFIPERALEVEVLGKPERITISGELVAGAAKTVITPPKALWDELNIYGEDGPIRGIIDDVHARALTLGARGAKERFAIISVELLVIPPPLRAAVKGELVERGLPHVHLLLGVTHTHTGPGNFWDVPFARFYMGPYHDDYFRFVVKRIADAVEASVKTMRPARIGFGQTQTRHLVKQRRYKEPVTSLRPPVDEELEVVRVDAVSDGSTIAYVLNLGAHPTTLLHRTAGRISGDYPGAVSRLLEGKHPGAVALFLQGACGSVRATTPRPYTNYRGIEDEALARVAMQADMLLAFVREAEAAMSFEDKLDLSGALVTVALPGPDAHFFPEERPFAAARVLTIIPNWIMNRAVDWIGLPEATCFQAVRINHAYLLTFPGDVSSRLGWDVKRHLRRDHVLLLGLANDYSLGYVLSREEYDMGGISSLAGSERVQCFYGKRAGPFCVRLAGELSNMVREEGASDVLLYRLDGGPGKIPGR